MKNFKKNKKKKDNNDINYKPKSNFNFVPKMSDDDDHFGEKENKNFEKLENFINKLATKEENLK